MRVEKVPFWENYEVAENGKIFNTKFGYQREIKSDVILLSKKSGAKKRIDRGRLVALVFIPNPENKSVVVHKNKNLKDFRAENLLWMNKAEASRFYKG